MGALADKAVLEPTFAFPITTVRGFVALAGILEGVGVSAYTGAAGAIANKAYISVAASILDIEARHASYVRSIEGQAPCISSLPSLNHPCSPMNSDQGLHKTVPKA